MRSLIGITLILGLINACSKPVQNEDNQDLDNWTLVWQDEFNGVHLDESKWNYQLGGHGWGNNELQYYTDRAENVFVENGNLVIQALKEQYENNAYTSARITTKNKGDWLYGRFEIRAKLVKGQGLWPAIWLLPTDWKYGGWAASGEIDIMELIGHNPDQIFGTIHFGGSFPENVSKGGNFELADGTDFSEVFHNFIVEWDTTEIRWYMDDSLYEVQDSWFSTAAEYPAPFDQRFHLLMNVAVGGNWPGSPDAGTHFPQRMYVDYVRIYKKADKE